MALEWNKLTQLTGGRPITIERVRIVEDGVAVEGSFEPPPLARLTAEDQAFVAAFVHSHGSIKQMEKWFGVSYPTIKNRLNHIAQSLEFVEFEPAQSAERTTVLQRLEDGAISVEEALVELEK